MAKPLLDDALWQQIQPLLPPPKPRRARYPGRKPIDDRRALTGIVYVLKAGIPWEELPQEMGCGSGMTCWRRLQLWQNTGAWPRIEEVLRRELPEADEIHWARVAADPEQRKKKADKESPADREQSEEEGSVSQLPQRPGPHHPDLGGSQRDADVLTAPAPQQGQARESGAAVAAPGGDWSGKGPAFM